MLCLTRTRPIIWPGEDNLCLDPAAEPARHVEFTRVESRSRRCPPDIYFFINFFVAESVVKSIVRSSEQADRPASSSNLLPEAERKAVLQQLELIVSHHNFKNSKRCVSLLHYLVEQALDNRLDCMKERILGVEVFGRSADYDTSSDPIVRTTATEIRKRLAQYYQETPSSGELKIELVAGSYIPQFIFHSDAHEQAVVSPQLPASDVTKQTSVSGSEETSAVPAMPAGKLLQKPSMLGRRGVIVGAVALGILAAGTGVAFYREESVAGLNHFWEPVFKSPDPVLICVGAKTLPVASLDQYKKEVEQLLAGQLEPPQKPQTGYRPIVALSDARATANMTGFLSQHNVRFSVRDATDVTLSDLRSGPLVLIGALTNAWTLRLTSRLRFHPQLDASSNDMWIEDSQHPERRDWKVQWGEAYANSADDYAVVSRLQDPTTGRVTIEIGGLGLHGTQTAGEFVTNPTSLNTLSRELRNPQRNVQIVLRTPVINGEAGLPQVVAVYYW